MAASMMLPYADPLSGEVDRLASLHDSRVPASWEWDRPAQVFGWHLRSASCPLGRHVWDVLVAAGAVVHGVDRAAVGAGDADGDDVGGSDGERRPVRVRLTCVRCGVVQQLVGVEDCSVSPTVGVVEPVPLRVAGLVAQQVHRGRREQGESRWDVYVEIDVRPAVRPIVGERVVRPVATVTWAYGMRGRRFFVGDIVPHAGVAGSVRRVEASTVPGCLRKLAAVLVGPDGAAETGSGPGSWRDR